MNAELLYTSAPAGLKKGSRGFCTVLVTEGTPINLSQRLESLSSYRHIYQPGHDKDDLNPTCYSFLRFPLGGRNVHVISRIAAYGVDYSQRTNKIAHHVVVDPLPECGPAALLQTELMRTSWDGNCRTVPFGPTCPIVTTIADKCYAWEAAAGDAGWGGVLASTWMDANSKPLWIVYDESQSEQMLQLIAESLALVPIANRWQSSFSTYCANLPPDIECRVRCVLAGSEEARMASVRGKVIDLTKTLSPPIEDEWVLAARSGVPPNVSMNGEKLKLQKEAKQFQESSKTDEDINRFFEYGAGNEEYKLSSETIRGLPPSISRRKSQVRDLSHHRNKTKLIVVGIIAFLCVGTVVGLTAVLMVKDDFAHVVDVANANTKPEETSEPDPQIKEAPAPLQTDASTQPASATSGKEPTDSDSNSHSSGVEGNEIANVNAVEQPASVNVQPNVESKEPATEPKISFHYVADFPKIKSEPAKNSKSSVIDADYLYIGNKITAQLDAGVLDLGKCYWVVNDTRTEITLEKPLVITDDFAGKIVKATASGPNITSLYPGVEFFVPQRIEMVLKIPDISNANDTTCFVKEICTLPSKEFVLRGSNNFAVRKSDVLKLKNCFEENVCVSIDEKIKVLMKAIKEEEEARKQTLESIRRYAFSGYYRPKHEMFMIIKELIDKDHSFDEQAYFALQEIATEASSIEHKDRNKASGTSRDEIEELNRNWQKMVDSFVRVYGKANAKSGPLERSEFQEIWNKSKCFNLEILNTAYSNVEQNKKLLSDCISVIQSPKMSTIRIYDTKIKSEIRQSIGVPARLTIEEVDKRNGANDSPSGKAAPETGLAPASP